MKKSPEACSKEVLELSKEGENKICFDCNQVGTTYVNITIGTFVCMACSGLLRGLNPPHRVKSLSMSFFSRDNLDLLKSRGNAISRKIWLGKYNASFQPKENWYSTRQSVREFMVRKYERKEWYLENGPGAELHGGRMDAEVKPSVKMEPGMRRFSPQRVKWEDVQVKSPIVTPPRLQPPAKVRSRTNLHQESPAQRNTFQDGPWQTAVAKDSFTTADSFLPQVAEKDPFLPQASLPQWPSPTKDVFRQDSPPLSSQDPFQLTTPNQTTPQDPFQLTTPNQTTTQDPFQNAAFSQMQSATEDLSQESLKMQTAARDPFQHLPKMQTMNRDPFKQIPSQTVTKDPFQQLSTMQTTNRDPFLQSSTQAANIDLFQQLTISQAMSKDPFQSSTASQAMSKDPFQSSTASQAANRDPFQQLSTLQIATKDLFQQPSTTQTATRDPLQKATLSQLQSGSWLSKPQWPCTTQDPFGLQGPTSHPQAGGSSQAWKTNPFLSAPGSSNPFILAPTPSATPSSQKDILNIFDPLK